MKIDGKIQNSVKHSYFRYWSQIHLQIFNEFGKKLMRWVESLSKFPFHFIFNKMNKANWRNLLIRQNRWNGNENSVVTNFKNRQWFLCFCSLIFYLSLYQNCWFRVSLSQSSKYRKFSILLENFIFLFIA